MEYQVFFITVVGILNDSDESQVLSYFHCVFSVILVNVLYHGVKIFLTFTSPNMVLL